MTFPVPSSPDRASAGRLRRLGILGLGIVLVAAPLVGVPVAASGAPRVSWSDRSVVAGGKPVVATVKPGSVPRRARVVLQRKYADRWRTADRWASETRRGLELVAPTDQYGVFVYRVAAVRRGSVVETSGRRTVTVRPPYDPAGRPSRYRFLSSPRYQWDACRTISWTFNPAHAPRKGLKQVRGAVRRLHAGTGLDFHYAGTTSRRPTSTGARLKRADVVVGWLGRGAFAEISGSRRGVGVGGARFVPGWRVPGGPAVSRAVSGGVVLNAGLAERVGRGFGHGFTWGEAVMHELGHVLGLDHVGARTQLMHATMTRGPAAWGAGDLRGLAKVGDRSGCLERSQRRVGAPRRSVAHHHGLPEKH